MMGGRVDGEENERTRLIRISRISFSLLSTCGRRRARKERKF